MKEKEEEYDGGAVHVGGDNDNNEGKKMEEIPGSTDVWTLDDYLVYQKRMEMEAAHLYPGRFDYCTFDEGYIRQRVYVCVTCYGPLKDQQQQQSPPLQPSGICYSCSMTCHANHEILDIYVKRNFRCDCGTYRMREECQLRKGAKRKLSMTTTTNDTTTANRYNHNFFGRYCECDQIYREEEEDEEGEEKRVDKKEEDPLSRNDPLLYSEENCQEPFVDPNTNEKEDQCQDRKMMNEKTNRSLPRSTMMIQCYFCEDWFHDHCIRGIPAGTETYVCRTCTRDHPFLRYYGRHGGNLYRCEREEEGNEEEKKRNGNSIDCREQQSSRRQTSCYDGSIRVDEGMMKTTTTENGMECVLECVKREIISYDMEKQEETMMNKEMELFMVKGWKERLCRCVICQQMYRDHHVEFLMDIDEEKEFHLPDDDDEGDGEEEVSLYEAGMKLLGRLDRRAALEGVWAMRQLGDKLKAYLEPFARDRRVVTKEDIDRFFQQEFIQMDKKKLAMTKKVSTLFSS